MKKAYGTVFGAMAGAVLLLSGCATTKAAFNRTAASPAAVMSVMANYEVSWYGEAPQTKGPAIGMVNKFVKAKTDENVQKILARTAPLMNDAADAVYEVLPAAGIQLADKNAVLNSAAYKSADDNKMYAAAAFERPDGFKLLGTADTGTAAGVKSTTGAASFVYVNYEINKTIYTGIEKNGTMTACVSATIIIADAAGKQLAVGHGYASGSDTIPVVAGIYDPIKLAAMYPAVIREALKKAVVTL
jgi:hypothetical protein